MSKFSSLFAVLAAAALVAAVPLPASADGREVGGLWRGSYECAQGETGLDFEVRNDDEAMFSFYPLAGQAGVSGSYSGRVQAAADGTVSFTSGSWIRQPTNYVMVDFRATLSGDGGEMTGTMLNERCGAVSLKRVAPSAAEDGSSKVEPLTR